MPLTRLDTNGEHTTTRRSRQRARTPERVQRSRQAHRRWAQAIILRDGACVWCGATTDLTADHITPLSRGGDMSLSNGQCLCLRCNSSKGNRGVASLPGGYHDPGPGFRGRKLP